MEKSVQKIVSPAQSEEYADFIVRYVEKIHGPIRENPFIKVQMINDTFTVLYVPLDKISDIEINNFTYNTLPKCYTYMDVESQNASGTGRLHEHTYLQLKGKGTAVAIIDSGIDYTNPLFIGKNGSRIKWLWDQTLEGDSKERVPYGRIFSKEEIDKALMTENPYELVPSRDLNGHGTAMAAMAAGNIDYEHEFSGAAPEADLYIVKLKPAKKYLKDFYLFPKEADVYQEDDIMIALSQLLYYSRVEDVPLSICLGLGSNQGAHAGESHLCQYLDYLSEFSKIAISVSAGNEGIAKHHYGGKIEFQEAAKTIEIKIGKESPGFITELWAKSPEQYTFSISSPTGEIIEISTAIGTGTQTLNFVFVGTKILADYIPMELETGMMLLYLRFLNPTSGIWKINLRLKNGKNGEIHMWLPVFPLISDETYFLEPSPYNTVTTPGDTEKIMTVTAYDYRDNSLYLKAGRGYSTLEKITPCFAAPGVNLISPLPDHNFGRMSGTSLAAANAAGAAALMLEWALVKKNEPFFTGKSVRYYFEAGARRERERSYPNREWGYGILDIFDTFKRMST